MDPGQLTSGLLWRATWITALIDTPLVILVARKVPPDLFRKLKWYLVGAAALVYAALWSVYGSAFFWDAVYHAVFPAWSRWLLPFEFGLLYGALALAFWRISLLMPKGQGVGFLALGGAMSLAGHGIGILRGLFRVPMLAGAGIAPALAFGVVEFVFYWCAIVGLGAAARWFHLRLRRAMPE